jgi:ribose transport system substrate-binding protein
MRFLQSSRWLPLSFCVLALFALVQFTGCSGEVPEGKGGKKRIIILTNGNSPYWDACAKGADDAAHELKFEEAGYVFQIERNDFKDKGQIDKLKSYASAVDIAAVGISVTDENNPAIADAMKSLRDAGIQVITIDSDVNREKHGDARRAYVGTDNVIAGRELGKAAKALVGKGDYMAFVGLKGASNAQGRIKGFDEGAGLTRAQYLEDNGPDKAKETVRNILTTNLDTLPTLLLGIWSYNTPAIVETLDNLERQGKVTVVGFDAEPNSLKYMGEEKVDALLVQNPYQMGYIGVKLLKALVEDDKKTIEEILPGGTDPHTTDLKLIYPDRDGRLKKELFDETTQFMPLGEFNDWLKKYGLTGS